MGISGLVSLIPTFGVDVLKVMQNTRGYLVSWPLQETSGAVSLADNIAVTYPDTRNVAGLTYADYTPGANWANSSGEIARHTAGSVETIQQDDIIAAGKTWRYPVVMSNRTAGSVSITGGDVSVNTNGTTIVTITAIGADVIVTPTSDFDGDLDLAQMPVQQTDIAASSAGLGLLDGDDTGTTPGVAGQGGIQVMKSYDGATSFTDIYSAELNSMFNPDAGTIIVAARVANAGVWTDGSPRYLIRLVVDADNQIDIRRVNTNNQITIRYEGSTVVDTVTLTGLTTVEVMVIAVTWDVIADEMKVYLNGVKQGATQTGIGAYIGNLSSTETVIGAANTTPNNVWNGDLAYPYLANVANTQPEIQRIYDSMRI